MKSILIIFLFSIGFLSFSQENCASALRFCTGTAYNYPLQLGNVSAPTNIDYGCIDSAYNQRYYFLDVSVSGSFTLNISVTPTSGSDVDFIVWGPFTSLTESCTQIGNGLAPSVDCSYSSSATETVTIPDAQVGQFYIMLVSTSALSQDVDVNLVQTTGPGSCDCPVGLAENKLIDFEISPNPVGDELTVKLKNNEFENVKILDQQGREILKVPIENSTLRINTTILENGVYFVKISETVQRFIKN
jgi:hypothetical protein